MADLTILPIAPSKDKILEECVRVPLVVGSERLQERTVRNFGFLSSTNYESEKFSLRFSPLFKRVKSVISGTPLGFYIYDTVIST